ncbi:MAG: hypothetical protein M5U28_49110 [Sandaracinaceae bacterium]|nr:hypothetical protein [Sandaracinaceae bacterium]
MELEDLLVQEGVAAAREQIRGVLDLAARDGRHPAAALIEEGIVAEDVLADLLARASGTIVVDLDRAAVDGEAPHVVSGTLARERLLLPIAAAAGKLRVAFVNPLDAEAVRAVQDMAGMPVQPLVGTLTGVRQAIETIYAGRTTRVVRAAGGEMPHEITRKVAAPDGAGKDTSPLHRLEQEATIEQRHEALLLALIERGALTRADYVEALKRLLSGRRE